MQSIVIVVCTIVKQQSRLSAGGMHVDLFTYETPAVQENALVTYGEATCLESD